MKKAIKSQLKWYNIVVVIILLLSLASWLQFARSMGSRIIHHVSNRNEVETSFGTTGYDIASEPTTNFLQMQNGVFYNTVNSMNTAVKKADSMWSVYKNAELSRIDSIVTYYGIGEVSSAQVIAGQNRWLFYKTSTDGNTIADFEGTNKYSVQEMERISQSAYITQNEVESRGIKFAIVVAPNKENIYWEYMPNLYVHAEESSTDELVEFLSKRGVNIVSPKHDLLDYHLSSQLYYSYDTHWNQLGAYIGVRNTLKSWNISMPDLSNRKTLSRELNGHYHYCGEDDLAKMAGLRSVLSDEKEYVVEGTIMMNWETFESEQTANKTSHFYNKKALRKESVFLVGDSFRSSMIPALREQFADVYVVHRSYYDTKMLDDIRPDYLIAEYVERYSGQIEKISSLVIVQ